MSLVAVGVLLFSLGMTLLPLERLLRHRAGICVFYAWSALVVAGIGAFGALDGGPESPLFLGFNVVVLYAVMAYPPMGVAVVSTTMVATYTVVGLRVGDASLAFTLTGAGVLTVFSAMGILTSANLRHQRLRDRDLTRRLRMLAALDPLTGCLNRRAFEEVWVSLSQAPGLGTGVCVVDLDGFKAVNDRKGHLAGDEVLGDVVASLQSCLRSGDHLARTGGDEFAALLTDVGADLVSRIAERMRAAVAEAGAAYGVTASVGWAHGHPGGTDRVDGQVPVAVDLVAAADAAMYQAKELGGDRVVGAPGVGAPTSGTSVAQVVGEAAARDAA